MNAQNEVRLFNRFIAAAACYALASGAVLAAPIKVEAVITPKAESRLDFADGSKRFLLATQREGKVVGTGPLAGATMLEWGVHDVRPELSGQTQTAISSLRWQTVISLILSISSAPFLLLDPTARCAFWPMASGRPRAERENLKVCAAPARCISIHPRRRNVSGSSMASWYRPTEARADERIGEQYRRTGYATARPFISLRECSNYDAGRIGRTTP